MTNSKIPILVQKRVLNKDYYNYYKNNYKFIDVKESQLIKETSKEKKERLQKIHRAIYDFQIKNYKGWFSSYKCDTTKLQLEFPYDDMRTCLKLTTQQPIPIENMKMLRYIRSQIGGPLHFTYYLNPSEYSKQKVIRYDS